MHTKITDSGSHPNPVKRLVNLWRDLHINQFRPTQNDFTPKNLKEWLNYIDVYDVEGNGVDFRIRASGDGILQTTHEDWWGRTARDVDMMYNANLHDDMLTVLKVKQPTVHHIRLFQSVNKTAYRILLPVYEGGKSKEISQIFLCLLPD